jgi:hypothetical protein
MKKFVYCSSGSKHSRYFADSCAAATGALVVLVDHDVGEQYIQVESVRKSLGAGFILRDIAFIHRDWVSLIKTASGNYEVREDGQYDTEQPSGITAVFQGKRKNKEKLEKCSLQPQVCAGGMMHCRCQIPSSKPG